MLLITNVANVKTTHLGINMKMLAAPAVSTVTVLWTTACVRLTTEAVFMVAKKAISETSVLTPAVKTVFLEIKLRVMHLETAKMAAFPVGSSPNVILIVLTISHIAWNVKRLNILQQTVMFSVTGVDPDFIAISKPVSVNHATTA
jgi:hypothetical protein